MHAADGEIVEVKIFKDYDLHQTRTSPGGSALPPSHAMCVVDCEWHCVLECV